MLKVEVGKVHIDANNKPFFVLDFYKDDTIYKLPVYTDYTIIEFFVLLKQKNNDANKIYAMIDKILDLNNNVIKKLVIFDYDKAYKCRVDFYTNAGNTKSLELDLIFLVSLAVHKNYPIYAEEIVLEKAYRPRNKKTNKQSITDFLKNNIPEVSSLKQYLSSLNDKLFAAE